jgi:predicted phage terminase large subunit-like protein
MQRLHESDVTGYLLSKKSEGIRHICLPAESSGNVMPETLRANYIGGLLDPDRLSREVLDEALVDLGSRGYAGQYGQSPVADGGNIIKNEWFQYISRADFERLREHEPIVFFGDTAFTDKKDENDPSGFIGTCKIGQSVYITGAIKVYKKFPDLIRFLPKWVAASGYTNQSTIRIEPKANGISVIDQLRDSTGLNVTRTPSPNNSKKQRLEVASPLIECGRVYVVIDHWNEDFIDEICGFPNKTHDEYVDLISYAIDYHLNTTVNQDLSKFF